MDRVTEYANAVAAGDVVAGPGVRAACARHLDDLKHGPARGLKWDPAKAQLAVDFFCEVLRLAEGQHAGKPFVLQPWQQFIVGSLFGWLGADDFRRFQMAYLEVGKGAGKTPLAAGVGLYLLMADDEEGAEVFAAAVTKDQAAICFRDAARMVAASPELASRIVASGQNPVYNLATRAGSFFWPVSAEGRSLDGKRPHGVIVDELHEHDSGIVLEKLSAGFKGRRQPLMLMITNSGWDRTSVCWSYHEYAGRAVTAQPGELGFDDAFFSFVCGLDEGDDPFESEECWVKANPNIGVSMTEDYLRKQVREAKGIPGKASLVRRLNFCEWTESSDDPWIEGPIWRACEVDSVDFAGRDVFAALDLSGTRDLTAMALASIDAEGIMDARVEFWTPGDTLRERMGANQPPWDAWVEAGHVHAPSGRIIRYDDVARRLLEIAAGCNLIAVGYDAYHIKFLEAELERLGATTLPLIAHPQGTYKAADSRLWMPHSIELLENRLFEKTIRIERNPCLWWNSQSAAIETDLRLNRTFSKKRSRGRIDGVVALAMAVGVSAGTTRSPGMPDDYELLVVEGVPGSR